MFVNTLQIYKVKLTQRRVLNEILLNRVECSEFLIHSQCIVLFYQSPGKGSLFEEKGEEAISWLIEMNSNELSTKHVAFCGL